MDAKWNDIDTMPKGKWVNVKTVDFLPDVEIWIARRVSNNWVQVKGDIDHHIANFSAWKPLGVRA